MCYKFKNPYLDSNFDGESTLFIHSVLSTYEINITNADYGFAVDDGVISIYLNGRIYFQSENEEKSVYEIFPDCIPEGMRYNKELDKLVPDITPADEYAQGIKVGKDEKIHVRENGFAKADLDKIDFTLVEPYAYRDLGQQLTIGEKKYSRDNWKKGDMLSYLAALERHINDVKIALEEDNTEKLIDDTGVNHGGALMFNSMAIHYFIRQILEKGKKC